MKNTDFSSLISKTIRNHNKKKQNQMSKDEYEHNHVKQGLETRN